MSYERVNKNRVIVQSVEDFGTVIDSAKEYFLDGIIDMGAVSIEIPAGGIYITGYNFNASGLISTANNYTLFTSPIGGSGDVLFQDFHIDISGTSSQVYDIVSDTGFKAVEVSRINFNNCTSLGTIDNYRQGLEVGTGRFGGTPELTLKGVWVGGYFIDTSIVRSLVDGSYYLFKAGVGFLMSSRFRSNQNADLNTTVGFFDFAPANFVNPSTVQLDRCLVSRNGVFDPDDATIAPNIEKSDLVALFEGNVGVSNTSVGGEMTISTEVTTTVASGSTEYDLLGTYTTNDLQHFSSPSNGQLRNDGFTPHEFRIVLDFIIESTSNNDVSLLVYKYDDSASTDVLVYEIRRQINALVGTRDVGVFTGVKHVELDENDYLYLKVINHTGGNDITAELGGFLLIEER